MTIPSGFAPGQIHAMRMFKRTRVAGTALGVRPALAVALAGALWGCFDPNLDGVVCQTCTDKCPGELECRNGYCIDPDSTQQCSQAGGGGSGSGGTASDAGTAGSGGSAVNGGSSAGSDAGKGGAGGTSHAGSAGSPSAGGKGGTTAESGGAPGSGGASGSGGADDGGTGDCGLTADVAPACSGQEFTAELSLPCGTAPFHWRITQGGDGLTLAAHGTTATLGGTLADAGDYPVTVSVTDASGVRAQRKLLVHVRDTPVITTTSLHDVCASELYSMSLAAEGGDGESYEWSSDVPEESGLAVADGKLGGLFTPAGASSLDVTFTVASGGCVSLPVTLPLERAAPADCPQIEAVTATGDLAAPCRGNDYAADLTVHGPDGSYVWRQVSAPAGLEFEAETQHISGTATAAGELTVDVTGAGRTVERTFEVAPRDTCWLAYIAPVNGVARLGLFDPVTRVNHTTPSEPGADPVTDFKFSPDGRFLAYRSGVSASSGQLTLVELPARVEHSSSFDQATHYAWSEDSSTLAVGFTGAGGPALGGIDVGHAAAGAGGTTYPELTPLAASVDSDLAWYAGTHVAFLSARTQSLWPVRAASLAAGGFGELVFSDADFGSASELRPGAAGVYVVPSDADFITFYGLEFFGDPNRVSTPNGDEFLGIPHDDFLISGTGNYLAGAVTGGLEVFAGGNPSSPDQYPVPDVPAPDQSPIACDAVLAWAPGADRLACGLATDGGEPADLVIVELGTDGNGATTAASTLVHGVSDYPAVFPSGRQRLFSRDGRRFAFTTENRLSVAQIAIGGASVVMQHDFLPAPGADDAVVAFSPAGHLILEHRGNVLSLFDVNDASPAELVLDTNLPLAPACQDSARAPAGVFCGSPRAQASFAWSYDAGAVAHATADGALTVVDLSRIDEGGLDHTTVTADCAECLTGRNFAFQP